MVIASDKVRVSLPRAAVWEKLVQTNKLNEALGLPAVHSSPAPDKSVTEVKASFWGIPLRWIEHPFEWVEPEVYSVLRQFKGNPLMLSFRGSIRLNSISENETEVEVESRFEPRFPLAALFLRSFGAMETKKFLSFAKGLEASSVESGSVLFVSPSPEVNSASLSAKLNELSAQPVRADLTQLLEKRIRHAVGSECAGMRAYAVADEWGADRFETLRLFLHATRAGVLDLEWSVLCPHCRVPKVRSDSLFRLKEEAYCETCKVSFQAGFDEEVELRFSVNPAIRSAESNVFCIGNPGGTPHVLAQQILSPGEKRTIKISLRAGRYRIRSRESERKIGIEAAAGAPESRVSYAAGEKGESQVRVKEGECAIELINGLQKEVVVMLEREGWGDNRTTAAYVTTLQEFRNLFSSEALAPGIGLGVKTLTFLFTDLKSSTRLYEKIGDSPAFGLVREHFELLVGAVTAHHGGIVKTMGDAVMAVFTRPDEGLSAAIQIQKSLMSEEWKKRNVIVKLGLHAGPCLAVSAAESVDYFGTTVNVSSRIEGMSLGGDLVFSEAVRIDPAGSLLLKESGFQIVPFEAELKGLTGKFKLYRMTLQPADSDASQGSP